MDLQKVRRVGVAAAYSGAGQLMARLGRQLKIDKKGAIDLVTDADRASESAIIATIRNTFPDHAVLAEESGLDNGENARQWIVDPLDGTTNFAHGLGLFCISIAFSQQAKIKVGVVLCPATGELFTATAGQGAFLNNRPIRVSGATTVSESLLVTGFPYNLKTILPTLMTRFSNCLGASMGVRRLGSAAIDLCYVACGRFDAFWEQNLKPWDTAAGWLIAQEAGAVVTDFSNRPFEMEKHEILATNGAIHREMISLLAA